MPKLPPFKPTAAGNSFKQSLSSDEGTDKLMTDLKNPGSRSALAQFFKTNETEVRSILREVIATPEGRKRMEAMMESEQGRKFLSELPFGLGVNIGGNDLWVTEGGRKLVKSMMATEEGRGAIYVLITGFYATSVTFKGIAKEVTDTFDEQVKNIREGGKEIYEMIKRF
jgi:hypothetical protein